jgi:hypothetical protein
MENTKQIYNMKKLILLLLTITAAFGQAPTKNANGFYAGASSMNTSALGQFDSTTKGFLSPRMTTTQRNAISSPATGLQIYNTTTNALNVYNGSAWVEVGSGGGGGSTPSLQAVSAVGNTITVGTSVTTLNGTSFQISDSSAINSNITVTTDGVSIPDVYGNTTDLTQGTLEFTQSTQDTQYGIGGVQLIDGAKQAVYDIDELAYTTSTGSLTLAHGTQTANHTATFPNKTGIVAMTSDIPATISEFTAGTTYTSGLAAITDASGSIIVGDWNGDVNGTTLEVNDTSKTIDAHGYLNQHYGNTGATTGDSSNFTVGPYTMYFNGNSGTAVDNFGTSTIVISPEEGNLIRKTDPSGDSTQISQPADAHSTTISAYDSATNTTSTLGVIPNDIAFTVQNDSDAYGLDMNSTGFAIIDENRTTEYALHLETGYSEINAGMLANNTLNIGAYDVNGTSMTNFIQLKSNNIPTMTLPQLAGSGTRMVTVTSTGDVGATTIPSGGSISLTTTGSSGASTLVGSTLNVPNYTLSGLGGVASNSSITGATKTKITYDSKGLVTAGADATTADIADSTDKRYVTDAQLALFTSLQTRISQSVALSMFFTAISPADATNYFASPLAQTLSTTESNRKFKMPYATTFRSVQLCMTQSASSTSETVSVYLRNYTAGTETLVGTFISSFTGNTTFNFTGLSIAIPNTTDEWDVKIATPTWTTNPTSWSGTITVIAN